MNKLYKILSAILLFAAMPSAWAMTATGVPSKEADKVSELCDAVRNKKLGRVTKLLSQGVDPNETTCWWSSSYQRCEGVTPLMLACSEDIQNSQQTKSSPDYIKVLISAGAHVDSQDSRGRTALMYAVVNAIGDEAFEILFKAGAQLDIKDAEGKTAEQLYSYNDRDKIIKNYRASVIQQAKTTKMYRDDQQAVSDHQNKLFTAQLRQRIDNLDSHMIHIFPKDIAHVIGDYIYGADHEFKRRYNQRIKSEERAHRFRLLTEYANAQLKEAKKKSQDQQEHKQ